MRTLLLLIICVYVSFQTAFSQDIIGKNRRELSDYMRQNYRDYRMRNAMNVEQLNFYKFEHLSGDKTIIAMFSEKGICEAYQLIVDVVLLDETLAELNGKCEPQDRKMWLCDENGHQIRVDVEESDWFVVLTKRIYTEEEPE
jgi:hypothetical protein